MNKSYWMAGALGVVAIGFAAVGIHHQTRPAAVASNTASGISRGAYVAGPGRVEPASEDIKVGSELSGKLNEVLVEEGDSVAEHQVVAVLVNGDYQAQVLSNRAVLRQREAELRKVINGARLAGARRGLLHRAGEQGGDGKFACRDGTPGQAIRGGHHFARGE